MTFRCIFQLNIKKIGDMADFELSWGDGQRFSAQLDYPPSLMVLYQEWQKAYQSYYRQLRGRVNMGSIPEPPQDWRHILVKAEAELLYGFHCWLRSAELNDIRNQIITATNAYSERRYYWVDIFLTCNSLELEHLPWETWEIGTDLGLPGKIRLTRTPAQIRNVPIHPIRRKARILAVLGDDTGLNFQADKQAVSSLSHIASVECVGWQAGKYNFENPNEVERLRREICQAIADERGWDILFFAGHSNETTLTGGELSIAPGVTLSINEIEESLKQAQKRGLQFAIFNSCSGINIANSLIDLGLSQVVVMREPIHDRVAQEFLRQFLRNLSEYKDVREALRDGCAFLETQEKRLNYPSVYLVPSLFSHPQVEFFRIEPFGFWQRLKCWIPQKSEVGLLVTAGLLSLIPQVQDLLLEPRLLVQALFRQGTGQVPSQVESPLLLVQIDNKSLTTDRINQRYPIDYSYLARLVERTSDLGAKLVGIDYVLDREREQPESTDRLAQSIRQAVKNQQTWFVFGSKSYEDLSKGSISPHKANLNWTMAGDIDFFTWYVELLPKNGDCSKNCPFAYLLALSFSLLNQTSASSNLPQPDLQSRIDFRSSLINPKNAQDERTIFLSQLRLHPISNFRQWFHPIIDFSIPPSRAYKTISACQLLETCSTQENLTNNLQQYIVLIVPGGYQEAGVDGQGEDNYTIPLAVNFWRGWSESKFPGGEAHAYMIHHLLTQRLVVPIPDLFMVLLAALLGKGITLILLDNPRQQKQWLRVLKGVTAFYAIVSLQVYLWGVILIPLVLPIGVFWGYIYLIFRKKPHG